MTKHTGITLPQKALWSTQHEDGSTRTTLEVDVYGALLQVVLDPGCSQWNALHPDDLVWLAARLLDADAMLNGRQCQRKIEGEG